jgi:hypothetical protein
MSRRLIGDRPMTPAERKRRSRALRARPTSPLDAKLAWDANLKAFENEALRPFASGGSGNVDEVRGQRGRCGTILKNNSQQSAFRPPISRGLDGGIS